MNQDSIQIPPPNPIETQILCHIIGSLLSSIRCECSSSVSTLHIPLHEIRVPRGVC